MEKPYRYRKKLLKSGNGNYVLLPIDWVEKHVAKNGMEVVVEVYAKEIRIYPLK